MRLARPRDPLFARWSERLALRLTGGESPAPWALRVFVLSLIFLALALLALAASVLWPVVRTFIVN